MASRYVQAQKSTNRLPSNALPYRYVLDGVTYVFDLPGAYTRALAYEASANVRLDEKLFKLTKWQINFKLIILFLLNHTVIVFFKNINFKLGAPRSMTSPIGTVVPVTTEAAMDVPAETVTPEKVETVTEIPTTADPEVIQNVESRRMDIDGAPIDGMYHYDEAADHAMAASANEDHFNSTDV